MNMATIPHIWFKSFDEFMMNFNDDDDAIFTNLLANPPPQLTIKVFVKWCYRYNHCHEITNPVKPKFVQQKALTDRSPTL